MPRTNKKPPGTLTAKEAAARLGITTRTLYRYVDRGILPVDWHAPGRLPERLENRPKGQQRSRYSLRYTKYRHRFDKGNGAKHRGQAR